MLSLNSCVWYTKEKSQDLEAMQYPDRCIRAFYTQHTIRVYQAYSDAIADSALHSGRFVSPPFKVDRMTWIKPSFLWMMYRSGWGLKDGQKRILAIDITREGFEWALENSCVSHFNAAIHDSYDMWQRQMEESPVRIQWDPERDINLNRLGYRSIQIGLSGKAVQLYMNEWIVRIEDLTALATQLSTPEERDESLLPLERRYMLPPTLASRIGADQDP